MDLDSNTIIASLVFSFVTGAGTWLWQKIRGKKTEALTTELRAIIEDAFTHEIAYAIDNKLSVVATRYHLAEVAWDLLERLHIPKNSTTKQLVAKLVEYGVSEVRTKLRELANERAAKELPAKLGELADVTKGIERAFEPPSSENRTVPPLGLDIEVIK